MRAALSFVEQLRDSGTLGQVDRVRAELLGSIGSTGRGHGTDGAVILGLLGERPELADPEQAPRLIEAARTRGRLRLLGQRDIEFDAESDLILDGRRTKPFHPNAMTLTAWNPTGDVLGEETYYSVGGGFIVNERDAESEAAPDEDGGAIPHPFRTSGDLLAQCEATGLSIAQLQFENELAQRPAEVIREELLHIWEVMRECIDRGLRVDGVLPGGLGVPRRAPGIARQLENEGELGDPFHGADWLTAYAMAVNEENAAGSRVVTAPTNGAAGIIPSVLNYAVRFAPNADDDAIVDFLLTAGAIGSIFKETASISGAEVGCQGEVGSACSMAAGAYAAFLGGTPRQVECAAEIGLEHHLGLTCDPIGGLVQIPCIERNGIASVKAVAAARTAMRGDGTHVVSLDDAITTMRVTGRDMQSKYKETSTGGLAVHVRLPVNVVDC
ncbi:L-serine dehydratase [Pseudoclavibacter endophyticus]|nr:L-serine dehydratase [Pseudoclavibacter endophyticus]